MPTPDELKEQLGEILSRAVVVYLPYFTSSQPGADTKDHEARAYAFYSYNKLDLVELRAFFESFEEVEFRSLSNPDVREVEIDGEKVYYYEITPDYNHKDTAAKAIHELVRHGFIKYRKKGVFTNRMASTFVLTFERVNGRQETNEWKIWPHNVESRTKAFMP